MHLISFAQRDKATSVQQAGDPQTELLADPYLKIAVSPRNAVQLELSKSIHVHHSFISSFVKYVKLVCWEP